ncbi:hypothetical protein NDU88_005032 [Pleurodeles waltl]|uniref:Uncharacterized protein n=1 Tax=Pleurodeles waltl TaxID=8319 RepID=A0AAV7NP16_PLEWA|nr:hypothetical protein NDU88_005032 [Pleurodeles waltl]
MWPITRRLRGGSGPGRCVPWGGPLGEGCRQGMILPKHNSNAPPSDKVVASCSSRLCVAGSDNVVSCGVRCSRSTDVPHEQAVGGLQHADVPSMPPTTCMCAFAAFTSSPVLGAPIHVPSFTLARPLHPLMH